ncbi:MAG: amidase [Nannocystaceae bacterium]|nr:amidase [Nannocystaceae bacterium]
MTVTTTHAFTDDALANHDAVALAALVRDGTLSAHEVATAAVARARAADATLNAVVLDVYDAAIARSAASCSGPFAGVPTFIKDMIDVEGLPTRFGSEAFRAAAPAKRTDPLAAQMFEMGMLCLGKSTMPEIGLVPSTEFPGREPTRNPWNLERTAGGSSGGAAALVAAGVVPIAHTADGGGSTRIPAACCGLVGMKPTRGRLIPSANTGKQIVSIVVDGVVTRSVRDTALYYAEAEKRHRNPALKPIGNVDRPLDRPLRIATMTSLAGRGRLDEATQREFDATVVLLESLGHTLVPFEPAIDERLAEDFIVYWSLMAFAVTRGGKYTLGPSFERNQLTDVTRGLARRFKRNIAKAPGAIYRLRKSAAIHAKAFADFDVVLTPTLAQFSPPLGYLGMDLPYEVSFPRVEEWVCFTPYANAAGTPSLSLPLGHDEETNLPVGMLFGGHHGDERLLLELALQLEQAQPWRTLAPASA